MMILGPTLVLVIVAAVLGVIAKYFCSTVMKWPWWVGDIAMLIVFGFVYATGPIVIGK